MQELRVAIVGSGPSGFYTAGALLGLRDIDAFVDVYDRLPTPWGLVRGGVAPDHPKIKTVSSVFEATAAHERFRFFGNVEVGRDISRAELLDRYDVIVYATGAEVDRGLGIPGEDLPGSVAASTFVGWYNGHPDHHDHKFDFSGDRAVVVGNGNVALDIARILLTPPDRLAVTDIADEALAALRTSRIREVLILGRRGPAQAAFTTPELRELSDLTGATVAIEPPGILDDASADTDHRIQRNLDVMRHYHDEAPADATSNGAASDRRIVLRFVASPVELRGDGAVEQVVIGTNELRADASGDFRAVDTGARETVEASLVLTAIGYRAAPIDGLPRDPGGGTVPHDGGRVNDAEREYVVGWVKRGPTGVIGVNKKCANETVARIVADLQDGVLAVSGAAGVAEEWLRSRQPDLVTMTGWAAIDEAERAAGRAAGRPRVKQCTYAELLATAATAGDAECSTTSVG